MKNLMMTTALVALTGTAALAQDVMFRGEVDPNEIYASEFIGMRVYSSEAAIEGDAFEGVQGGWEDIGEINDVILTRDGTVEAVLVDIGGFLGMGERRVAVDMDAVRFVADSSTADDEADFFLVMNATRANFEEAPEYTPRAMDGADQTAAAPARPQGAEGTNQAAPQTAERPQTGEQPQAQPQGTVAQTTPEQQRPADGANVAENRDGTDREPIMREGYQAAATEDLNTEMLTGAPVYDSTDEWIGEIAELLVNDQGQITDAVVDVGGFLGIGEKPVQLALDDIDILRQAEGGDDVRIYVSMTKEELEAMPTYDK